MNQQMPIPCPYPPHLRVRLGGYAHGPCSHFGRPLLLQNGPRDLGRPFCVLPLLLLRWGPCCVPTLSLGLPRFPPPFLPGVVSPGRPRVGVWPLTPPPFFLGWPRPALTPLWAIASATAPPICPGVASPGPPRVGLWPRSPPPFFPGWPRWSFPRLGHDLGPLLHFSCDGLAWSSPPWAVASVPSSIFSWGGLAEHTLVWGLAWVPSSIFFPLGWPRQAHFYPGSGPDPLLHFSWAPPKLSTLFSNPMPPPPFFPGVPSRGYHLADVGSSASAWGGIFRGNPMFGLVCGSAASARRVPIWGHRFAKKGPSASKFAL